MIMDIVNSIDILDSIGMDDTDKWISLYNWYVLSIVLETVKLLDKL